jgi:hypothetical protein
VAQNCIKPGIESTAVFKTAQRPVSVDESFLQRVFCILTVAQDGDGVSNGFTLISLYQMPEGFALTFPATFNGRRVVQDLILSPERIRQQHKIFNLNSKAQAFFFTATPCAAAARSRPQAYMCPGCHCVETF